jgi:hypothetical protein
MENIVAVMDYVLQGLCNVCKSTLSISEALSVSKKEYVMHLMMFEIHYAQKQGRSKEFFCPELLNKYINIF